MKSLHALVLALGLALGLGVGACSGSNDGSGDTTDAGTNNNGTDAGTNNNTDAGTNNNTDAGTTDAGNNTNTCTGACSFDGTNDCECFMNADCGTGYRCESTQGQATGECKCGPRGTKTYDAACTDSNECDTGVCADGFCTKECQADSECSGSNLTKCNSFFGICILPPT